MSPEVRGRLWTGVEIGAAAALIGWRLLRGMIDVGRGWDWALVIGVLWMVLALSRRVKRIEDFAFLAACAYLTFVYAYFQLNQTVQFFTMLMDGL